MTDPVIGLLQEPTRVQQFTVAQLPGVAMCSDRGCGCWTGDWLHAEGTPGTQPAFVLMGDTKGRRFPSPSYSVLSIPVDLLETGATGTDEELAARLAPYLAPLIRNALLKQKRDEGSLGLS